MSVITTTKKIEREKEKEREKRREGEEGRNVLYR
jgi:hypothetical protein